MASRKPPSKAILATVDRVEGSIAVLDAGGFELRIDRSWLPDDVREGDGFTISISPQSARSLDGSVRQRLDALTAKRRR